MGTAYRCVQALLPLSSTTLRRGICRWRLLFGTQHYKTRKETNESAPSRKNLPQNLLLTCSTLAPARRQLPHTCHNEKNAPPGARPPLTALTEPWTLKGRTPRFTSYLLKVSQFVVDGLGSRPLATKTSLRTVSLGQGFFRWSGCFTQLTLEAPTQLVSLRTSRQTNRTLCIEFQLVFFFFFEIFTLGESVGQVGGPLQGKCGASLGRPFWEHLLHTCSALAPRCLTVLKDEGPVALRCSSSLSSGCNIYRANVW